MQYLIYTIIFFSFFDLFTQLPVISTLAESVGSTAFVIGIAVGMYSFSNTFGNIISGIWTDRKNPSAILVIGLFATSFSLFLYRFIDDPTSLLIVRFIHGLVGGLIVPTAFTYLANSTSNDKRGKSSAISGAFVGIAAISGPAFSGILASRTSVSFVFSITSVCMFLLGIVSLFALKKYPIVKITKRRTISQPTQSLFRNTGLLKAFTGAFFLMFAQGVIAYLLPLQVAMLGYDSTISGTLFSTFGIVAVLVFLLPTNRIFDIVSPIYTLSFGIVLMGCSLLLLSYSYNSLSLYIAMACYGIGFGFLFPSINSLLIDSTNESTRGKAYGYFYSFFSLGVVAGSSLLGWLSLSIQQGFWLTGFLLITFSIVSLFGKRKSSHSIIRDSK